MFEAGQEITLEVNGSTTKSTIRGWNAGGYFLLDAPPAGWRGDSRDQIICRTLRGSAYVGFTSSFLGILPEIKMMVLKYPEDIVQNNFRRGERRTVTLPVTIYRSGMFGTHTWPGMIADISEDGCRFSCGKAFEVDEKVFLEGRFPTGGSFEKIELSITSSIGGGDQFVYGGQFKQIDDDENKALLNFLEKLGALPEIKSHIDVSSDHPDIPLSVACQLQVGRSKYNTAFRGEFFPKYVFLDVPLEDGERARVPALTKGIVRFLSDGTVYGFESEIVKQYDNPIPLLVMRYPDNIEKMSLRKSRRIKTFLPGRFTAGENIFIGAVVDLSEDGCLFTMGLGEMASRQEGVLQVDLPGGDTLKGLRCSARSVWSEKENTNVGLFFEKVNEDEYSKIKSFYNTCIERLF